MGKLSKILLNSIFLNSAFASSFSVTDCSNDVSTLPGRDPRTIRLWSRSVREFQNSFDPVRSDPRFLHFSMNDRLCFEDTCFFGLFISMKIKGALSLEIDEEYFINNIEDDGSYGWDAGDELYTKTITAVNLDFSIDNDGK